MSNIDRLITEQVMTWSQREKKAKQIPEIPGEWPVITISRQFGAKGRTVAKELNKKIGFKIWDKELLSAIAEEAGADERFLASLDERRRKLIDDTLYGSLMGSKHTNTHYFRSLLRVVHTISEHGKGIIVGRGSNYIIKSGNALRVRLVSPIEERESYVAERQGISLKESKKLVSARDIERNDFISHYFKRDAGNPQDFDLILNSKEFDMNQIVEIILLAYEKKIGKSIPILDKA